MKRVLISLALGLLIVPLLLATLLVVKIIWPGKLPPQLVFVFTWIVPVLRRAPFVEMTPGKIVFSGFIADYLIFSLFFFVCIGLRRRIFKRTAPIAPLPPQPPSFAG